MSRPTIPLACALLAACHRAPTAAPDKARAATSQAPDLAAQLATEPEELADLRQRCRTNRAAVGEDTCAAVSRATRLRFMHEQPDAYAPGVVSGDTGNRR